MHCPYHHHQESKLKKCILLNSKLQELSSMKNLFGERSKRKQGDKTNPNKSRWIQSNIRWKQEGLGAIGRTIGDLKKNNYINQKKGTHERIPGTDRVSEANKTREGNGMRLRVVSWHH